MKRFGLNLRMGLPITGAIVVVLGTMIFLQVRHMGNYARQEAFSKADEMANRYGSRVEALLNDAILTTRTVAQTFEGMKLNWVDDRGLYNGILSQVLKANTNYAAVWSCWEPDALDGKDKTFAGKAGHDETGRFIPLWVRGTNDVQLDKLADYAQPGRGDFYLAVRERKTEVILDPRTLKLGGREVYATTLAAPVSYNGDFVGAVGVHLPMDLLQRIVAGIRPYETGEAGLIAQNGQYVAHGDASQIGQPAAASHDASVLQAIREGRSCTATVYSEKLKTDLYRVFVPVRVGSSAVNWSLAVSLPMDRVLAEARRAIVQAILFGVVAVVVITVIVILLARSIARPLNHLTQELRRAAETVGDTSAQMADASRSLAEGASDQAASLEETGASLEEISSMARQNSSRAADAKSAASAANQATTQGAAEVKEMIQAMEAIKTANAEMRSAVELIQTSTAEMRATMDGIQSSSSQVAQIIKTIDEIAFQTNILALNAAVEAARAGEAGMGFAVVADEVRNLAQRSAQAARETTEKIEAAIQRSGEGVRVNAKVAENLEGMVAKVKRVDQGIAEIASRAALVDKRLQEIVARNRESDQLAADIAASSEEQNQGISQVNVAIARMDKVTQSNAAGAEESASAAEELKAQAGALKSFVEQLSIMVNGDHGRSGALGGRPGPTEPASAAVAAPSAAPAAPVEPVPGKTLSAPVAPAPAGVAAGNPEPARGNQGLPMPDDFKDF